MAASSVLARVERLEALYLDRGPRTATDEEVLARLEGRSKPTPTPGRSMVNLGCAVTLKPAFDRAAEVRARVPLEPPDLPPDVATAEGENVDIPPWAADRLRISDRSRAQHVKSDFEKAYPLADYGGDGAEVRHQLVPEHV